MKAVLLLCCASMMPAFAQNKTEWFGFASYPGARQLCDQNLMGQGGIARMEIHWRSYATRDAFEKVAAYYQKTQVKDVEKEPNSLTLRLDKDTTLSVYPASATQSPTCENKPKAEEKTVIVVSRAARR
jgi:hypothetical protein